MEIALLMENKRKENWEKYQITIKIKFAPNEKFFALFSSRWSKDIFYIYHKNWYISVAGCLWLETKSMVQISIETKIKNDGKSFPFRTVEGAEEVRKWFV